MKRTLVWSAVILSSSMSFAAVRSVTDVDSLCEAIKSLQNGDRIELAPGTYDLSKGSYASSADSYFSLSGYNNFQIVGTGADASETIITSDGATSNRRFLSFRAYPDVVISNLTITGFAKSNGGSGAVYYESTGHDHANATIVDCVISNNWASGGGGAFGYYQWHQVAPCDSNAVTLIRCLLADNHSGGAAGAVLMPFNGMSIDCVFRNNSCTNAGGAVAGGTHIRSKFYGNWCHTKNNNSSGGGAIVSERGVTSCYDCIFEGNWVDAPGYPWGNGGAVHVASAGSIISNCTFRNCYAGGGVLNCAVGSSANGLVSDCTFVCNTNMLHDTYMGRVAACFAKYVNCLFATNRCNGAVCGGYSYVAANCLFATNVVGNARITDQNGKVYNSTFVNNKNSSGNTYYGCIHPTGSTAVNCAFYMNRSNGYMCDIDCREAMKFAITNSVYHDVMGAPSSGDPLTSFGALARGNEMKADFRFANAAAGDYRPARRSPLRDFGYVGDDVCAAVGEFDLAGNPRFVGKGIDAGCYEFGPIPGLMLLLR